MLFPRIPSRPVRYALIATHAFRDAISDVEVDFTKAERAIADRLDAVQAKLDEVMDRLAAYEEANDETKADEQPKAKAKAKAGTKRRAKK
jgi:uncharacterized membrane protein YukC